MWFSFVSLLYMMHMLLVARDHYTIDVLAALVIGSWWYRRARDECRRVDMIISLPY